MQHSLFFRTIWLASAFLIIATTHSFAHFPWLDIDNEGHALLFFGESPAERTYHTPDCVANAKLMQIGKAGKQTPLEHVAVENDSYIGRRSTKPVGKSQALATSCDYGIYHGTLLSYDVQHVKLKNATAAANDKGLAATLSRSKGGIDVKVTWNGEPLPAATVTLVDSAGQQANDTTNNDGRASFRSFSKGLTGFIVGHKVAEAGEVSGEKYESQSHYLTITTNYGKPADVPKSEPKTNDLGQSLPVPVASFGAVVCDGYLYAYGGHTGRAHTHSRENLSNKFVRLKLDGTADCEELPMPQPLQGLPIVAHNGKIYRVGGLDARNAPDEDDDMHSVATFAEFDPTTSEWHAMPDLPAPRSSHNAVVIGDKLYVAGGWTLSGDDDGEWQDSVVVFDFNDASAGWKAIGEPPFKRRALAVATAGGKLFVLGGMNDIAEVCSEVFVFDPQTGEWSRGPDFPGEKMNSFGMSAWGLVDPARGECIIASGMNGSVYALSMGSDNWQRVAQLSTPRFFHQIVPDAKGGLLAVAGATPKDGHVATIESIKLDEPKSEIQLEN